MMAAMRDRHILVAPRTCQIRKSPATDKARWTGLRMKWKLNAGSIEIAPPLLDKLSSFPTSIRRALSVPKYSKREVRA